MAYEIPPYIASTDPILFILRTSGQSSGLTSLQKEVFAVRFDSAGQNIASAGFDRAIRGWPPRGCRGARSASY